MATIPQFGEPRPGRDYGDRQAAFGIAERDGKIALVFIQRPEGSAWHDLPGGGVDPGEVPELTVAREFGEEAGLIIRPGRAFLRADQYFINTEDKAWNNRSVFFAVELMGEAADLKIEDDHSLVWVEPFEAITLLRHESHAWAVAAWLRRRR